MSLKSGLAPSLGVACVALIAGLSAGIAHAGDQAQRAEPTNTRAMKVAPLGEAQKARLALDRLGFGARPGEVAKVQAMGVRRWMDAQLDPASIPDPALAKHLAGLTVPSMSTAELYRHYPNPAAIRRQLKRAEAGGSKRTVGANSSAATPPVADANDGAESQADKRERRQAIARIYRQQGYSRPGDVYLQLAADRLLRATYSERQLQEVMVDFWGNHFNVYARKNISQWFLPSFDRETIRPHAMGKFRDLLLATAQSPAMLFYLDNYQSVAPGASPNRAKASRAPKGINENYARELMELHTLGVNGGYTQQDIKEVARCLTGWTILDPRGYGVYADISGDDRLGKRLRRQRARSGAPEDGESGTFYFNAKLHDPGSKIVLGQRIDAGGIGDGRAVIDLLARQPATARFIAGKLAEKFVSDTPSPALVARVAAAFTRSDGDIHATLASLFHDPEFFAPKNYRAKIKTPFELVASSLRALQADTNGREVQAMLSDLGQPLYGYQAPTGYSEAASAWVNSGALLKRMNFAIALAANRIPGTQVDLAGLGRDADASGMLDTGLRLWLGDAVSPATRNSLVTRLAQPIPEATLDDSSTDAMDGNDESAIPGLARGQKVRLKPAMGDPQRIRVAALVLGSPEFQRQ